MSEKNTASVPDLVYGLNDRPPSVRTLLYGLQWLVIFLPTLTLVSILVSDVLGLDPAAGTAFFQRLLLVTGASVVIQTLWGHQLPLQDGPAMALIITLAALAPGGTPAIAGGMIFGGFLIFLCGLLGLMRFLTGLFTGRVIGVILLLIGLTLLPYLLPMLQGVDQAHPHGRPLVLGLGLGLILIMALMFHYLSGLLQSLSLFIGVILGAVVFALLGLIDLSGVRAAPWLAPPKPFFGPWPEFDIAAVISFSLAYLAVLVNAMGSLFSLEPIVAPDNMGRRLNRGLAVTGLSGIMAGAAGVVGTVPYSGSPGIITMTRVGSRYAVTACGLIMLALAFLGKLTAVFTAVPDAVVAAALLAAIAAQIGVSIEIIHRHSDRMTGRDYMIVGLPVLLGTMAGLLPPEFLALLPAPLRPIIGNGLIVGLVLVLALEHVLLVKKKGGD